MRLLNQMLNLSRIFDCFSRRCGKVVFNLKLSGLVDSDVPLKAVTSRIKLGTGEIRRLSWVMITVSSITKSIGRISYDTYGICYIPVNFVFNLPHNVTCYMHHTG